MTDTVIERRLLGLIGLGMRGRNVVVGVEQVRVAARKGALALAVVAPDASANSLKKIVPLLAALRIPELRGPGAAKLGAAVGRDSTAVVGVTDRALARGMRELLEQVAEQPRHEAADRRRAGGRVAAKVARRNG